MFSRSSLAVAMLSWLMVSCAPDLTESAIVTNESEDTLVLLVRKYYDVRDTTIILKPGETYSFYTFSGAAPFRESQAKCPLVELDTLVIRNHLNKRVTKNLELHESWEVESARQGKGGYIFCSCTIVDADIEP